MLKKLNLAGSVQTMQLILEKTRLLDFNRIGVFFFVFFFGFFFIQTKEIHYQLDLIEAKNKIFSLSLMIWQTREIIASIYYIHHASLTPPNEMLML